MSSPIYTGQWVNIAVETFKVKKLGKAWALVINNNLKIFVNEKFIQQFNAQRTTGYIVGLNTDWVYNVVKEQDGNNELATLSFSEIFKHWNKNIVKEKKEYSKVTKTEEQVQSDIYERKESKKDKEQRMERYHDTILEDVRRAYEPPNNDDVPWDDELGEIEKTRETHIDPMENIVIDDINAKIENTETIELINEELDLNDY